MELVVVSVAVILAVGGWVFARRRRAEQATRRMAALAEIAQRVDAAVAALDGVPDVPASPPQTADRVAHTRAAEPDGRAGRTALVDAIAVAVSLARADGSRVAVALVRSDGELTASRREQLRGVAGVPIYAVGTRSAALVFPGVRPGERAGRPRAHPGDVRPRRACGGAHAG
jgi:hypothetical protein